MNKELEQMIETYKHLIETKDMTPEEKAYMEKRRRNLWWEIRQARRGFSGAMQQRIYRSAHPERVLEQWIRQRDKARRLKIEVLTLYGNDKCGCVRCGEARPACLSIDHIEGRGSQHRKGAMRSSSSFYAWLKKNGYPKGYQTLCMNCQFIKRFENHEEGKYATDPIDWQSK